MTAFRDQLLRLSEEHGWPWVLRQVAAAAKKYNPCEPDGPNGLAIFDGIRDYLMHSAKRLDACAKGRPDPDLPLRARGAERELLHALLALADAYADEVRVFRGGDSSRELVNARREALRLALRFAAGLPFDDAPHVPARGKEAEKTAVPRKLTGLTARCVHGPWDDRCAACWDPNDPSVERHALEEQAVRNRAAPPAADRHAYRERSGEMGACVCGEGPYADVHRAPPAADACVCDRDPSDPAKLWHTLPCLVATGHVRAPTSDDARPHAVGDRWRDDDGDDRWRVLEVGKIQLVLHEDSLHATPESLTARGWTRLDPSPATGGKRVPMSHLVHDDRRPPRFCQIQGLDLDNLSLDALAAICREHDVHPPAVSVTLAYERDLEDGEIEHGRIVLEFASTACPHCSRLGPREELPLP